MALFLSSKRSLALQKNRKLIAVKLSMGDKNSSIRMRAFLNISINNAKFWNVSLLAARL